MYCCSMINCWKVFYSYYYSIAHILNWPSIVKRAEIKLMLRYRPDDKQELKINMLTTVTVLWSQDQRTVVYYLKISFFWEQHKKGLVDLIMTPWHNFHVYSKYLKFEWHIVINITTAMLYFIKCFTQYLCH